MMEDCKSNTCSINIPDRPTIGGTIGNGVDGKEQQIDTNNMTESDEDNCSMDVD